MADVHLIWYTVDDAAITASRTDVRAWAEELGLPQNALTRRNMTVVFCLACDAARIIYTDKAGTQRLITARETSRRDEFVTYEAFRDDGMKMAQIKFFNARHSREGVVAGTHVLKSVVRKDLPPLENEAANAWIAEARAQFKHEEGHVPWSAMRRVMRAGILLGGTPVRRRPTAYFAYDDELGYAQRVGEFMRRAVDDGDFTILAIEDTADYTVFAESADQYLLPQVEVILSQAQRYLDDAGPFRRSLDTQLKIFDTQCAELRYQHARHERRLGLRLPHTSLAMLKADQAIVALRQLAHLPSVTGG